MKILIGLVKGLMWGVILIAAFLWVILYLTGRL